MVTAKLIFVSLFIALHCGAVFAQSRINQFTAIQYKEQVQIGFIITPGQSCTGYQIQRSDNLTDFETLYDFSGICGDAVKPQNISYTDSSPLKTTLYYRAFIPPGDYSEIITVNYLDFADAGYILFSNPVSDIFNVRVNSHECVIELFNTAGEKVTEFTSDPNGLFTKNLSDIPGGLYHFLIKTAEGRYLRGRFIKI